jgi:hypothetical protein
MIHTTIHYPGQQPVATALPTLPPIGAHLVGPAGGIYVVRNVVFDAAVHLYLVRLGDGTAAELRRAWSEWGVAAA